MPLSHWVDVGAFVHMLILIYGGFYTYALTPLGNWAKEAFHLSRNHYDRVGHVALGVFPVFMTRVPTGDLRCIQALIGDQHQVVQRMPSDGVGRDAAAHGDVEARIVATIEDHVRELGPDARGSRTGRKRAVPSLFFSNPAILWQRRSLNALSCFAEHLITIDSTSN